MKLILLSVFLLFTVSIVVLPNSFADDDELIVITKGQNYDLIENFIIGEATFNSHPERIMDNGWKNYALSNTDNKVIWNTNAVGTFIFDKNSCSYSIWENGFDGGNIIPSVSAVATFKENGVWSNLPINNEVCSVTVNEAEDNVVITSTKRIADDVVEDVFIPYTGTTENFYLNATNTNFDLIQSSNGTNTGYYNGQTITTSDVILEEFTQEIILDIRNGFKETFKVIHQGNQQLGISQTVHSETGIIEIADQVVNIAELNGESFDREYLEENKAQIFEIADSLNYNFDTSFQYLTNVNIIFDDHYKVNMDFSEGNFIGYLEIDPTFTATGSINGGNWDFDLSSLSASTNGITGGSFEGTTLTSSQISSITSSLGSTWSTATSSTDYKVHTFTSDGNFVVSGGGGSVTSLLVAGGGGGGAGGGGGGGVLTGTTTVTTTTYPVVRGSGGQIYASGGSNGGDSTFNGLTAGGGGMGGYNGQSNAGTDGDGTGGTATGTRGTYGEQGINGGGSSGGTGGDGSQSGGSGGGANEDGDNTGYRNATTGGDGLISDISGTPTYYGGGGGGGGYGQTNLGGQGGGGTGGNSATGGTANYGGGGGGSWIANGQGGGTGIVILRYVDDSSITATGGTVTTLTSYTVAYPQLSLNWVVPTVADPPTGLTISTGIPIETQWTAPVDDGNSAITGYKVFRTLNQYSQSDLPNSSANANGVDFTNNELLIHGFENSLVTDKSTNSISVTGEGGFFGGDLSTATFVTEKSYSGYETAEAHFEFANNGLKLYIVGDGGNTIDEWACATAYDVSTCNYVTATSTVTGSNPYGITVSPDGLKIWHIAQDTTTVYEHTLGTAYDISTITLNAIIQVLDSATYTKGLQWNNDGTKLYFLDSNSPNLDEWVCSTAYNINTCQDSTTVALTSASAWHVQDFQFANEGKDLFWVNFNDDKVYHNTCSTAWLSTSCTTAQTSLDISSKETTPNGLYINPVGNKLFISGNIGDDITEYSLTTGTSGNFVDVTTPVATTGFLGSDSVSGYLEFSDSNLPDNTDNFTIGSWIKLDTDTNQKLLNLNDITFSISNDTAKIFQTTTTGGLTEQSIWGTSQSQDLEDFTTYTSSDNGASTSYWTGSGNSANLSIDTGNDRFKIKESNSGSYINSKYIFGTGSNGIPNDTIDWKLRMKVGANTITYSGTGSNPYDASWQFHVQNPTGTNKIGHIFEFVPWQLSNVGGLGADLKTTSGNEHRKLLTPNFKPTTASGTPFWVEYDVSKSTSTVTISIWTSSGYSGTPNYEWGYTGSKVDALTGIDRVVVQDNSYNGLGGWDMFIDDIELIVDTTTTTDTNFLEETGLTNSNTAFEHHTFTRDGSTWKYYKNAVEKESVTSTTSLGSNTGENYTSEISGSLDEFFINSDALSQSVISDIYGRGETLTAIATTNSATTEYDDSSVTGGTSYYYSVKTTNAIGDSSYITPFVVGLAGTPPDPPTGISATIPNTATAPLAVTVSFSPSGTVGSGTVTGFQLLRDGVAVATDGLVTSLQDTAPAGGTTYAYTVKALGTHGNSVASASSSVTTPNTPAQVTGLTVTPVSKSRIDLSWNTPSDNNSLISGYKVQISSNGGSSYTDVLTGNVNTVYQSLSLSGNAQYHYKVSAINGVGTGTASDVKDTYTMTPTPASLTSTPVSEVQINLSWGASTGASGYKIEYESPTGNGFTTLVNNTGTVGTTHSASGLTTATQYNFKVSGWNNGGTSVASPESSSYTWGILQAPVLDTITRLSPTSLKLDFTAGAGLPVATGYKIERQTGTGWIELIADTGNTDVTYSDYVLSSDQSATYRLYAINSIGTSLVSNELTSDAVASSGGGGGGSSGGAVSSQTGSTGLIDLTFIDQIHRVVLGQFLSKSINVAWDSSDNLEVKSIIVGDSPFRIVFQDVPFVLIGDQSGISNGKINYSVQIPSELCTQQGQLNCVEQKQYEIPVEIQSVHKGSTLTKSSVIKIDLAGGSDIPLVFVLLAIGAVPLAFIIRKVGSGKSRRKASGSSHKSSKNGSNSKKVSL